MNFTQDVTSKFRKYGNRGDTSLAKFISSNGQTYGTLTLDTRRASNDGKYPVAIRVANDGKVVYLRIGKQFSMEEWMELCECEKQGRNKKSSERKELKAQIDKIEVLVNQMTDDGNFTLNRLQKRHQGKKADDSTIYSIWDEYLQAKIDGGKAGTARIGKDVKSRFVKDMGEEVEFSDIDRPFVLKWIALMKKDQLSTTYIGIVLRAFRTIVNICISRGLVRGNTKEMFKDTGYNKKCSRKHEFLDVETMHRLYDFWEKNEAKDANGEDLYFPKEKHALFRDLGLFLFMYLGDGQNLADTLRLEYDGWYFATQHKQLRFLRHKTRERNEDASEVIFPVTPEIKKILDKYANEPKLGQRVFQIMNPSITPAQEIWVIQRYNRYIRQHMAKVAKLLGMEQLPSPTWARHSFATNLNNSGHVPYKYISDSMGHSSSGDITSNYIGAYPLEKMLEYNSYLLNDKPAFGKEALLNLLRDMSEEERRSIMQDLAKE